MSEQITFGVLPNSLTTDPRSSSPTSDYDDIFSVLSTSEVDLRTAFVLRPERAQRIPGDQLQEFRLNRDLEEASHPPFDTGAMRASLAQDAAQQARVQGNPTPTTKSPSILRTLFSRPSTSHNISEAISPRSRRQRQYSAPVLSTTPRSSPLSRDPQVSRSHDGSLWQRRDGVFDSEEAEERECRHDGQLTRRSSIFWLGKGDSCAAGSGSIGGSPHLPSSSSSPNIPPTRSPSSWFSRKAVSTSTSSPDISPSKSSIARHAMSSSASFASTSTGAGDSTPTPMPPRLRRKPSIPEAALDAIVSLGRRNFSHPKSSPDLSEAELRSWRYPAAGKQSEGDMEVLTSRRGRRKLSAEEILVIERASTRPKIPDFTEPLDIRLDGEPASSSLSSHRSPSPPTLTTSGSWRFATTYQSPIPPNSNATSAATTGLGITAGGLQPPPRPRKSMVRLRPDRPESTALQTPRRVISNEAWSQVSLSASTKKISKAAAKKAAKVQTENGFVEVPLPTPPPSPPQLDLEEV